MATLNIRHVPDEVVAVLKARAARDGRSLNSEVVRTLIEAAERRSVQEVLASIAERRGRLPTSVSADDAVERLRRDREERGAHLVQEATCPRLDR